jgi:hypothetical protein
MINNLDNRYVLIKMHSQPAPDDAQKKWRGVFRSALKIPIVTEN